MAIRLEVYQGGTHYTYDETVIMRGRVAVSQKESGGKIEMASVRLSLDTTTFLGKTSAFNLPRETEGYRAQVVTTDSTGADVTVINGVIRRVDVKYHPVLETWDILVVEGAAETFLKRLQANDIVEPPAGSKYDIYTETLLAKTTNRADRTLSGGINLGLEEWYNLTSTWVATIDAIENVDVRYQQVFDRIDLYTSATGVYTPIQYDDSGTTKTYEHTAAVIFMSPYARDASDPAPNLPVWTARELFERMQEFFGWRLRAEYAEFPGTTVRAYLLTDKWITDPSVGVALDSYLASRDADAYPDPVEGNELAVWPDFAFQMGNSVDEPGLVRALTTEAVTAGAVPPHSAAIYAAPVGKANLSDRGQGQNENVVKPSIYVAHVADFVTLAGDQPDAVNHPNFYQDIDHGRPVVEEGKTWISEQIIPSGYVTNRVVHAYKPQAPVNSTHIAGYYAANWFRKYGTRRSPHYTMSAFFDLWPIADTILPAIVGDPEHGYVFRGTIWSVRSIEIDAETFEAEIKFVVPSESPTDSLASLTVAPPTLLSVCIVGGKNPPSVPYSWSVAHTNRLTWTDPDGGTIAATGLEIERYNPTTGVWDAVVSPVALGVGTYDDSVSPQTDPVQYRIRSLTAGVEVGAWVFATSLLGC